MILRQQQIASEAMSSGITALQVLAEEKIQHYRIHPVTHFIHFLLALATMGMWTLVWILHAAHNSSKRATVRSHLTLLRKECVKQGGIQPVVKSATNNRRLRKAFTGLGLKL